MKRRETTERFPRPTAITTAASTVTIDPRIGLIGFMGMILVVLLGARIALAEPSGTLEVAMLHIPAPPPAAIAFAADTDTIHIDSADADRAEGAIDAPQAIEVADEAVVPDPPADKTARIVPIELLFMNSLGTSVWSPLTTDEALAVAVSHGTNRDLKRRNPFRKRSSDLFKTKFRQVTILRTEMKMRLRLRAKASKAISVEVRF
jgi:hypothetical protein